MQFIIAIFHKIMVSSTLLAFLALCTLAFASTSPISLASIVSTSSSGSLPLSIPSTLKPEQSSRKNDCCRQLHDVYIVENSQQMADDGHSKKMAENYMYYHYGEGDYMTLIFFGGNWNSTDPSGYYYSLNHVYRSNVLSGGQYIGSSTYDAAVQGAIDIVRKLHPERTRITIFSRGVNKLTDRKLIQQFTAAKTEFQKKTGCTIQIRCLFSYQDIYTNEEAWKDVQPFKDLCQSLGAEPGLGIMNLFDRDTII